MAVITLVEEWWNIRYTIPGMNKWLHRNGFSYKKPVGVPHKYSAERQQAFTESYEKLKEEAGDAPILFIDGVHPTQGTKLAYGWMLKGRKTAVETTGSRTRLNLMGALNLKDIGRTVIREYDTINAENIARFFIAIRETYPFGPRTDETCRELLALLTPFNIGMITSVDWGSYSREVLKEQAAGPEHLHPVPFTLRELTGFVIGGGQAEATGGCVDEG
ncbi:insertion element iso-IS1n protein insB [Klebsiella variicola]|nr:insertion element iso-IS1n protein insB [Klebsiella variicola]